MLRVATLEEVAHYGHNLPPGLRAPIMGAAPPALVGSVGAAAQASTAGGSVTPTFGTGETRAAGNLLVCWATDGQTGAKVPTTTTTGWSTPTSSLLTNAACCIMLKVATGGDAAPTVTGNGRTWAQVAEFTATTATADSTGSGSSTASPISGTAGSPDAVSGELVLVSWGLRINSPGATLTAGALTFNNATLTTGGALINDSSSVQNHFRNGYAVTTTNATAGSASTSWTGGTTQNATICFVTLLLPAAPGGAAGVVGIRRPVDMRTTPSTRAVFTG